MTESPYEISLWTSIGSLIKAKEEVEESSDLIRSHVIAVTGLHKNRKATVVDTAPRTIASQDNPLVKKVPFAALDRRITRNDTEAGAVAFIGISPLATSLMTAKQKAFLENMAGQQRRLMAELVDQIEDSGWELHTKMAPENRRIHLLDGRSKRRYRLDRRLHDLRK